MTANQKSLGQYFTPFWAAAALTERAFPGLGSDDFVLEPTCGRGAFLAAIPTHVPAVGIEIDPQQAEIARETSGRPVLTGDFRDVVLDRQPTAIVGNPPFQLGLIDALLDRAMEWLPRDGRMGLILPAYALQTPSRVARYSEQWSIWAEMLPRTLFPGLHFPLSFVVFQKDQHRALFGLALYQEVRDVEQLPKAARAALDKSPGTWHTVVTDVLRSLGGEASIDRIYAAVEPKRPTGNPFWKEQIRKVLRHPKRFHRTGLACYALAA